MTNKQKDKAAKRNRLLGLLLFICGLLIAVSLFTHSQAHDTALLVKSFGEGKPADLFSSPLDNKGGIIGVFVAYALLAVFGYVALLIPLGIWALSYGYFFSKPMTPIIRRIGSVALFFYFIGLLFSLGSADAPFLSDKPGLGGLLGHYSAHLLKILTGTVISYTVAISLLLGSLIWILPADWGKGKNIFGGLISRFKAGMAMRRKPKLVKAKPQAKETSGHEPGIFKRIIRIKKADKISTGELTDNTEDMIQAPGEKSAEAEASGPERVRQLTLLNSRAAPSGNGFCFPDIELLNNPPADEPVIGKSELESTAAILKETLATFGVELANGEVEIYPGPIITRFEFKPAPGVKIAQIVNLADDLALAMKAKRIRIVAPIPGKSAVGVEIPNRVGRTVYLREIITANEFQHSGHILPLALGKTIAGEPFVVNLATMPHLLIAGATGSGKSVCLNCIITSLLYKQSPETLRFIMIDPKMLELTAYNDLPHLEKPVVTEMKYAEKVLGEAVVEMEERYRRLAKVGVRNIADYNQAAAEPIPYVVIIVDELADLMMIGSGRIEMLITRLAQMARAVGIHIILATQRPSVDVITGLIKANFSTRIAFQVATKVDSRTILDVNGAEKLLGLGDMLYMNPAFPEPKRVHGAFVSGAETQAICKFMGTQEYQPKPIGNFESSDQGVAQYDPAADAIFKEAIKLVIRHKQGSVSLLQRRLGIGYQRAARLIDQLEESGIVGPYDGSKAREVLVDEQYLKEKFKDENIT